MRLLALSVVCLLVVFAWKDAHSTEIPQCADHAINAPEISACHIDRLNAIFPDKESGRYGSFFFVRVGDELVTMPIREIHKQGSEAKAIEYITRTVTETVFKTIIVENTDKIEDLETQLEIVTELADTVPSLKAKIKELNDDIKAANDKIVAARLVIDAMSGENPTFPADVITDAEDSVEQNITVSEAARENYRYQLEEYDADGHGTIQWRLNRYNDDGSLPLDGFEVDVANHWITLLDRNTLTEGSYVIIEPRTGSISHWNVVDGELELYDADYVVTVTTESGDVTLHVDYLIGNLMTTPNTNYDAAIREIIEQAYDAGYEDGYRDGYKDGYADGYEDAVNDLD